MRPLLVLTLLLMTGAAGAQNPMNWLDDPEPSGAPGRVVVAVVLTVVALGWMIFAGPLSDWYDRNEGKGQLLLWLSPLVVGWIVY